MFRLSNPWQCWWGRGTEYRVLFDCAWGDRLVVLNGYEWTWICSWGWNQRRVSRIWYRLLKCLLHAWSQLPSSRPTQEVLLGCLRLDPVDCSGLLTKPWQSGVKATPALHHVKACCYVVPLSNQSFLHAQFEKESQIRSSGYKQQRMVKTNLADSEFAGRILRSLWIKGNLEIELEIGPNQEK